MVRFIYTGCRPLFIISHLMLCLKKCIQIISLKLYHIKLDINQNNEKTYLAVNIFKISCFHMISFITRLCIFSKNFNLAYFTLQNLLGKSDVIGYARGCKSFFHGCTNN